MTDTTVDSAHLGPDDVSAFVAAGPRCPAGHRIVAHLEECPACREEVLQVARLVRAPLLRPHRVRTLAAAAAVVLLVSWLGLRQGQRVDRQRATSDATAPAGTIEVVAPLGPVAGDSPLRFTWRGVPGAAEYRVTLLDAQGDVLWSQRTLDTLVVLPIETSLVRGPSYFWFVDVLQSDGASTTSGTREFRLSR